MEWKEWIGKCIFVQLKSGAVYSGKVIDVEDRGAICFICITDKYGDKVCFANSEIIKIKEESYRNG